MKKNKEGALPESREREREIDTTSVEILQVDLDLDPCRFFNLSRFAL